MVNIPSHLDLNKFIDKDFGQNKTFSYRLYGVVNHFGNVGFGHYNCLIKLKKNNKWTCFDDKIVVELDEEMQKLSNAYILIYLLNSNNN